MQTLREINWFLILWFILNITVLFLIVRFVYLFLKKKNQKKKSIQ